MPFAIKQPWTRTQGCSMTGVLNEPASTTSAGMTAPAAPTATTQENTPPSTTFAPQTPTLRGPHGGNLERVREWDLGHGGGSLPLLPSFPHEPRRHIVRPFRDKGPTSTVHVFYFASAISHSLDLISLCFLSDVTIPTTFPTTSPLSYHPLRGSLL